MSQQKITKLLSLMGVLFLIWLGVSYIMHVKNRGDVITAQIKVPESFARQFSRVVTKNRVEEMPSTPFLSPKGARTDWSDFDGNHVLVNFWATWCAPCVVELPSLDKLQKQFEGKGLDVIAVSIDTMRSPEDVKAFLYNRNIGEFAAYMDYESNVQKGIYMRGIPTSYLLDPKGNVLHIFEGDANWASPVASDFFTNLIFPTASE